MHSACESVIVVCSFILRFFYFSFFSITIPECNYFERVQFLSENYMVEVKNDEISVIDGEVHIFPCICELSVM